MASGLSGQARRTVKPAANLDAAGEGLHHRRAGGGEGGGGVEGYSHVRSESIILNTT